MNEPRGYTGGVSRASRLGVKGGKGGQRQAERNERLKIASGAWLVHVGLRLAGCEVRATLALRADYLNRG